MGTPGTGAGGAARADDAHIASAERTPKTALRLIGQMKLRMRKQ
jgi:hypothetical protein